MHCDSLFHKQSSVFCDIGEWCQCGTSVRQVELQRLQKGWIMEIRTKVNLFHTNREILKFFILFVKCKKNQLVQLNQYVHKKGQTLHGFSLWTVCMVWITSRVWARIWSLGDNLSPWLKFWGTFSFLGGQNFVHPSADAKGFVFLAGLLIGLRRKSQILGNFWDKFAEKSADFAGVSWQTSPKRNR